MVKVRWEVVTNQPEERQNNKLFIHHLHVTFCARFSSDSATGHHPHRSKIVPFEPRQRGKCVNTGCHPERSEDVQVQTFAIKCGKQKTKRSLIEHLFVLLSKNKKWNFFVYEIQEAYSQDAVEINESVQPCQRSPIVWQYHSLKVWLSTIGFALVPIYA